MRIVVSEFISLDGVVQAPGGPEEDTDGGFAHGGWSMPYFDEAVMGSVIDQGLTDTTALLFGRRTWAVMAAHWPERVGDAFAERMNSIDKYVASRTLNADEVATRWTNSTLLDGDGVEAARALKASGDGTLQVMGSSSFARQLAEHDLVDEYVLMIEPIMLGGGKTIFPADGRARRLELVSAEQAPTGVLVCRYRARPG